MINDRQPSKVPAHWTPRLSNNCLVKRGKQPPITDRRIVFAAKTDAALSLLAFDKSLLNRDLRTYNGRYESIR
jgi:hypothetical protein